MSSTHPCERLFTALAEGSAAISVPMRLLRRSGQPFLLLPAEPRLAARALDLYAAQTPAARAAKALLRFGLVLGFPVGLEKIGLNIAANDAFANYLAQVVEQAS